MLSDLSQSWFFSGMLATLALAGTATVGDQPALAQTTPRPCHLLTSAQNVPEGFGAAYNLFSTAKELLLNITCSSFSNATLTVGDGQNTLYVYRLGYEWTGTRRRSQIALGGTNLVANDWYVGSAKATLTRTQTQLAEDNLVVAYICLWLNNSWKCGCRDSAGAESFWQLQSYNSTASSGTAPRIPELPFDIPSRAKLAASPKKIFVNYHSN